MFIIRMVLLRGLVLKFQALRASRHEMLGPRWWDRRRLWWLASKSHGFNGDAQLERSGDRATPNVSDLTRTVYSPSPSSGIPHGDKE
ncbi:hypothetical protein RHMOL_Rhmol05G0030800 [Rhododendron molle]|uniref:Uncharacterized protein n=1 Tax=Rhododendron molle TaxID=49168 RepID=A0ACC0NJU5_RHOML|nr:hypothetical protein RHMOL_Rhmol05G0030800 [Rhododendron molle]